MPEDLRSKLGVEVPVRAWLTEPLDADVKLAVQRLARLPDVVRVAIMPDVHLAEPACVGVALATTRTIYPQAVGGDIGCGVTAMPLHAAAPDVEGKQRHVLDAFRRRVPILRHREVAHAPEVPEDLLAGVALPPDLRSHARRNGVVEMGTLGRGNHFLELQADDDARLWLCVHSGSRGMGQLVHARAAKHATKKSLWSLDSESDLGRRYLDEAAWCVRYAEANRRAMLEAAAATLAEEFGLEADRAAVFGTTHNAVENAFIERPDGSSGSAFVHRKGASVALGGSLIIIPGSMGTRTYHALGLGVGEALYSCSHGGGRVMSRSEARQNISAAAVARQLDGITYDQHLINALREEAPSAYRDIRQVMRAQSDLVRIVRTLRTLVCHKGV